MKQLVYINTFLTSSLDRFYICNVDILTISYFQRKNNVIVLWFIPFVMRIVDLWELNGFFQNCNEEWILYLESNKGTQLIKTQWIMLQWNLMWYLILTFFKYMPNSFCKRIPIDWLQYNTTFIGKLIYIEENIPKWYIWGLLIINSGSWIRNILLL